MPIKTHKIPKGELIGCAFDRETVRTIDQDGRLHVESANISKANVCPYYGREIPNWQGLGLEPDRIYKLYRDATELAKAVETFNRIPLLDIHVGVNADNPQKQEIVGTTGSHAEFDGTYLKNSLSVWDSSAIAGIETNEKKELSSSYHYVADMTAGTSHDGEPYDGRMTEIAGNHVALVTKGRAGADVVVGDSLPLELMSMKSSKKTVAMRAALGAHLRPSLAQDGALPQLRLLVTEGRNPAQIAKATVQLFKPTVALDEAILVKLLQLAHDEAEEEEAEDESEEEREEREKKEKAAKDKAAKDKRAKDKAAKDAMKQGEDESNEDYEVRMKAAKDKEDDDDDKKGAAMDAALVRGRRQAVAEFQSIRQAERDVAPLIGELALDGAESASDIYRLALDAAGVNNKHIQEPAALKAMVELLKTGKPVATNRLAHDAATAGDFKAMFPNAQTVRRS